MEILLTGKNALVGGSSKGIGRAIAERLAASGASVTLMARSEDLMAQIVESLPTDKGQSHAYLVVNFSDFPAFKTQMDTFFSENTVDILINNTQGPAAGSALEKDIEECQTAFDLLFKCAVYTTNLALSSMQKNNWGRIVNVASITVREPLNYLALSNSLRSALVSWGKSLAIDIAKDNITLNSILTGYFDTERLKQLYTQKAKKMNVTAESVRGQMKAQVPMQRIGDPEEYANLVCFLASNQASYITGTSIPIDGGLLKSF